MAPEKRNLDDLRIDRSGVPAPARWPWLVGGSLLLAVVAAVSGWWVARPAVAEVTTATAREVRADQRQTVLDASGYVTARRQATVSSKVTGRVTEVLIEEGQTVTEGKVLARLDSTNVVASLDLAEARQRAAAAGLAETEVRISEADLELQRVASLVGKRVASRAELDRAQAEIDSLRARLVRQRQEVTVAESEVQVWRRQLEDTVIRAPFTGVIVAKNAQPGEMISPISAGGGFTRTGIGTIVDMASLEIEVDVNEAYINRVRAGQEVEARLDAYPDWPIPAHVIAIIPTADRQRATVQVRIGFDSRDPRILPDMGAKVAFKDIEQTESDLTDRIGVLIPAAALRLSEGRQVVLVVATGQVERRAVTIRQAGEDKVLVLSGLTAGETVVVEGPADLKDGDRVQEVS